MLLHRLTTRYVSLEDRICLTGETETGDTVRLWLTRRLLGRLLPALFRWLEKAGTTADPGAPQPATGTRNATPDPGPAGVSSGGGNPPGGDTATMAAQGGQERPVSQQEWLVRDIDLSGGERGVKLVFNPAGPDEDAEAVTLVLETRAARQWIVILYRHFQKAGWPVKQWPAWLRDPAPESASVTGSRTLH